MSVAALAGGGFVATWQDNSFLRGDLTRSGSIVAQRFDNAGNKVGGEILVDTRGINFVNDVNNVVGLANGGFAVTWQAQSNVGDFDNSSIQMQIFDANGNKVGTEIQVNTKEDEYQQAPKITELSNGYIVVTWEDVEDAPGDGGQIKGQVFDGEGNRVGDEFTINSNSQNNQHSPAIAALSGGRFIVTWTDNSGIGTDNQDDAIRAQIFSVSSAPGPGAIDIAASLGDNDGSEVLALSVSGIPVGVRICGWAPQLHGDGWQYQRRCDRLVDPWSVGCAGAGLRRRRHDHRERDNHRSCDARAGYGHRHQDGVADDHADQYLGPGDADGERSGHFGRHGQ